MGKWRSLQNLMWKEKIGQVRHNLFGCRIGSAFPLMSHHIGPGKTICLAPFFFLHNTSPTWTDMLAAALMTPKTNSINPCKPVNQRHLVTCNQHEYIDIKGQPPGSCNASQNDRWQACSHRPQCKPSQGTPKVLEQWYEQTSSTDKNVWAGPFVHYLLCAAAVSSNRSVKPCLVQHLDWKHQRWNQSRFTAVHLINVRTARDASTIDRFIEHAVVV